MSIWVDINTMLCSRAKRSAPSLVFLPRIRTTPRNSAMWAEMTDCWVASPVSRTESGFPKASTSLIRSEA